MLSKLIWPVAENRSDIYACFPMCVSQSPTLQMGASLSFKCEIIHNEMLKGAGVDRIDRQAASVISERRTQSQFCHRVSGRFKIPELHVHSCWTNFPRIWASELKCSMFTINITVHHESVIDIFGSPCIIPHVKDSVFSWLSREECIDWLNIIFPDG